MVVGQGLLMVGAVGCGCIMVASGLTERMVGWGREWLKAWLGGGTRLLGGDRNYRESTVQVSLDLEI